MKKMSILSLAVCFFCACSSSEKDLEAVIAHQYSQSEADTIYKYLQLVDSQYVFTLSEEDALAKGVSRTGYKELEESLSLVNQSIKDGIEDGVDLVLFDPQKLVKERGIK